VLARPFAFQVRWRSLSEILGEAGYETMFIHGSDLDFDHMGTFLKGIGFHNVFDRDDFPPSLPREESGWVGYHDEQVMRVANDWFSADREQEPVVASEGE
jgi:phosphoglycerol transferase MdoB-like AlkP superfamily enzyme